MKKSAPALLLMIVLSLVIGASTLRRGHEWGDDFAWYILQAKSIWDGTTDEFMEQSAFTNYQSTTHLGPLAYPWGYPLILTPVYAIKGINPLALKLPALLFYAGFLVCLYFLVQDRPSTRPAPALPGTARQGRCALGAHLPRAQVPWSVGQSGQRLTQTESLLLVSLFAFNPLLLQFLNQILSDIPFLFFSTLSLFLMTQEPKRGILPYALMGVSIFFTAFLRVTGVLLLGCYLIIEFFHLLNNRKDRTTVMEIVRGSFIVCSVFILLWIANLLLFPSGGESYFSQYAGLVETAKRFAVTYFNVFSTFFGEATGWRYLYYFLLIFFLIGAWQRRKQETIFLLFFGFWIIVHITYPYWQGPRYIFPLLPIFIYFTFQGMKTVINKLPARYHQAGQTVFYGFWLLMSAIFLFTSSVNAYANLQNDRTINGPFDPYSREVYDYIKQETPPDSVVIFFKPRVMVIMTDHPTIMSTECDRMLKGDYLVLSRKVGENQQITPENIDACNLPLNQVLKNNRFVVYQIQK